MIKIDNPVYMSCKEILEKYPNYMVWIGKYKDLNETHGNHGGYPFMLLEEDDLEKGLFSTDVYPEWKPTLLYSTFPMPEFFYFDEDFEEDFDCD
ncbi:MAG: hypothetical protein FWG68_07865 [Defluviitaleaceae bacterium]|nr:hypothetical protein [Defluviitaleaceae bacterium]